MWIYEPGEIDERLTLLGTPENVMYLVKGDRHMLVGGGAQWMVAEFERQVRQYGIDMDRVKHLLIGHTHYDHATAVPYLKKRYPHIEVMASAPAVKLFGMAKAVENIRLFSRQVMETLNLDTRLNGIPLEFEPLTVERVLREGDPIELGGGVGFTVFETPGHSRCSLTVYEPRRGWLFPSDSMPWPYPGRQGDDFILTAFEGFGIYLNSLAKLRGLDVNLCGWEHYGALTEADARDIVDRVINFTLTARQRIRAMVADSGDPEAAAGAFTRQWVQNTGFAFLKAEIMQPILRHVVASALEEKLDESLLRNL